MDHAAGYLEIGLRQFFERVIGHPVAAREFGLCIGKKGECAGERDGYDDSQRDRPEWRDPLHEAAPLARPVVLDSFARNDFVCSVRSSSIAANRASPFSRVASVGSPKLPERL